MKKSLVGLLSVASVLVATQSSNAAIIFQSGNQQYDNVNIAADIDALSIVGAISGTPDTMTFNTMIGPNCSTQVSEHGQHGVAFVESTADSLPGATHTGFCSLHLTAQPGTSWFAGDFALDQLVDNPGSVFATFSGINFSTFTTSLPFDTHGQSQYNFLGTAGEQITDLRIFVTSTDNLMQDIKQVSLGVTGYPIPEPLTLSIFGGGLVGAAALRRRNAKKA